MNRKNTGQYIISTTTGENFKAFVPAPLPPVPPLEVNNNLREQLDNAILLLGRLDSLSDLLPDPLLFIYMYVRKEAVLSSQIEGTQSSLSDLLLFENDAVPGVPIDDVREVSNYVSALNHGLERIKSGFPISSRLIRDIHRILLSKGRGSAKKPGEFRRSQNWIGGSRPGNARFVPPPHDYLPDCMSALENFIHDKPQKTPILIKAALVHAQFETIHPFLDGNGRLGRLLITLMLCSHNILKEPMLYLSLFFKNHRQDYYECLQDLRTKGNWEHWLSFFLEGIILTAEQAIGTAKTILSMQKKHREIVVKNQHNVNSVLRVFDCFQLQPVASIQTIAKKTELSPPTISSALKELQKLGIVEEVTGMRRNRLYRYKDYLAILSEGTQPL
ncbi:MAG: Fic family protein [candidate division Zixibacteria bacterium]|nr:Fic family protein [candidate division Zixibacteria bacterium]